MSDTLRDISDAKIQALELIAENDGEMTEAIEAWFDLIEKQLESKVDAYAAVQAEMKAQAEYYSDMAKAFTAKAKTVGSMADSLKDRIQITMQKLGVKELSGSVHRFALTNAAKKLVIDEEVLDHEWLQYVQPQSYTTPDKQRIKDELAKGGTVAGARLEPVEYVKTTLAKKPKLPKGK